MKNKNGSYLNKRNKRYPSRINDLFPNCVSKKKGREGRKTEMKMKKKKGNPAHSRLGAKVKKGAQKTNWNRLTIHEQMIHRVYHPLEKKMSLSKCLYSYILHCLLNYNFYFNSFHTKYIFLIFLTPQIFYFFFINKKVIFLSKVRLENISTHRLIQMLIKKLIKIFKLIFKLEIWKFFRWNCNFYIQIWILSKRLSLCKKW